MTRDRPSASADSRDAASIARLLTGAADVCITPLGRGGNGRSFRLETPSGDIRFLKLYPNNPNDRRDRLGTERAALNFLRSAGLENLPEFLAADRAANAAILSWIEGTPIDDVSVPEIDGVLELLRQIHSVRTRTASSSIGPASEACFRPLDAVRQIEIRAQRLSADVVDLPTGLIDSKIVPLLEQLTGQARHGFKAAGLSFEAPLDARFLTFSPSDLGFHNALRRANGDIVWIDFEYFGWDDPVKLVADFLLHPAMTLSAGARRDFVAGARNIYCDDDRFLTRLKQMVPLYDLRWCMIILNAFDPAHHARHLDDTERAQRLDAVMDRLVRLETGQAIYEFGD